MKYKLIEEEMLIQEHEYNYWQFEQMDKVLLKRYDDDLINVIIVNRRLNNVEYYLMQNINAKYNVEVHNHQLKQIWMEEN
jgi:hypothetical protein